MHCSGTGIAIIQFTASVRCASYRGEAWRLAYVYFVLLGHYLSRHRTTVLGISYILL